MHAAGDAGRAGALPHISFPTHLLAHALTTTFAFAALWHNVPAGNH